MDEQPQLVAKEKDDAPNPLQTIPEAEEVLRLVNILSKQFQMLDLKLIENSVRQILVERTVAEFQARLQALVRK